MDLPGGWVLVLGACNTLSHILKTLAQEYILNLQDGRHELGRELHAACEGLVAKNLTRETPHLQTIESIVKQVTAYNITIHPDELEAAYTKLEDIVKQSKSDIDKILVEKRRQFIREMSDIFYREADLIQQIVAIQAQTVRMCQGLNRQIENAPGEVNIPTIAEIFAALCIGEPKHVQGGLGLTFTLEQK